MRRRIAEQHRAPAPWDVKYRHGGLIDIEFMVQYGQLLYGPQRPEVLAGSTMDALERLRDNGYFDGRMSHTLIEAPASLAAQAAALQAGPASMPQA